MAEEAYFRIPNSHARETWQREETLKKVALILSGAGSMVSSKGIAKEGDSHDKMEIHGKGQMYQTSSGYKYQVGVGNDLKMDEVLISENIYLMAYRYGKPTQMQEMCRGICQILRMDYIYNLSFENKVKELIFPIIQSGLESDGTTVYLAQDKLYEESRSLISSALVSERIFESELQNENIQQVVLQAIMKQLLK